MIKMHFNYLFSLKTVIIIVLSLLIDIMIYLKIINGCYLLPKDMAILNYHMESLYFDKLILYFITIYIYINAFSFQNINYYYIICSKKRISFVLTKIITILLIEMSIYLIVFTMFNFIAVFYIDNYSLHSVIVNDYLKCFLQAQVFGLLGGMINLKFKNNYIFVFVYLCSIVSMVIEIEFEIVYLIIIMIIMLALLALVFCISDLFE